MKKSTFSTTFLIQRGKAKADGTCTILARIIVNGQMTHVSTKFRTLPERWLTAEGRTLGKTKEEKEINSYLEEFRSSVIRNYYDMQAAGQDISVHKLKMKLCSTDENSNITVSTLFQRFIENYETVVLSQNYGKESFFRYKICRDRVMEFIKKKYGVSDLPLTSIDKMFLDNLYVYLRSVRELNNNTAVKFMHRFSSVFKMARDNGWVVGDPFKLQHLHLDKVDRGYLTAEEVDIVMKHEFSSKRMEAVRDVFIFCCYTGLPYIDAKKLERSQLIQWPDGNWWLTLYRTKTKVPVNVRLLDIPLAILKKYEGKTRGDLLLPVPSNQKCNEYLKEMAELCGIHKNITFHVARHTFATSITLGNGVPIESVSKMLGHTKISTTQIYARITDQKVNLDMEALASKLNPSSPSLEPSSATKTETARKAKTARDCASLGVTSSL